MSSCGCLVSWFQNGVHSLWNFCGSPANVCAVLVASIMLSGINDHIYIDFTIRGGRMHTHIHAHIRMHACIHICIHTHKHTPHTPCWCMSAANNWPHDIYRYHVARTSTRTIIEGNIILYVLDHCLGSGSVLRRPL